MKVKLFNCAHNNLNKFVLMAVVGVSVGAGGVEATTYSPVTFTSESPSMPGNPGVYYAAYSFTAAAGVSHGFTLSGATEQNNINEATITVYSTSFDPLIPSSNSPTDISSGQSLSLTNGVQYYAVVQSYADTYTLSISPAVENQANTDLAGVSFSGALRSKGDFVNTVGTASVTASGTSTSGQTYVYAIDNTVTDFTKIGNYNLTLLGQNQYAGSTTISAGTLSLSKNSIPSASTINLSGGVLGAAASFTLPNAVVLNQASTIDAQGQEFVLSGNVSGSYGLTITSSVGSAGSVSLTGSNTYAGATTVAGGKLKLAAAPNGAQITFNSGASFQASGAFSMNNAIIVNSTTFDANGSDVTLSGQITGANMTKTGAGTLTLSGTSNQQTGTITVSAGTLAIQSAGSLGDNEVDISLNGGTLKTVGTVSPAIGNCISVNTSSSIDTSSNAFTLLGSLILVSGTQLEVKDSGSGGVFDVSGSTGSSSAGTVKITGGTYRISDPVQLGVSGSTQILNGGTLRISNSTNFDASTSAKTLQAISMTDNSTIDTDTYTVIMANAITASPGMMLTKAGTGTMILSAANTLSGPVHVSAGELDVSNPTTQLSNATYVKLSNGAHLKFTAGGVLSCPLVL